MNSFKAIMIDFYQVSKKNNMLATNFHWQNISSVLPFIFSCLFVFKPIWLDYRLRIKIKVIKITQYK